MATQEQETMTTEEYFSMMQWQNGAVAAVKNQTRSTMSLDRFKQWAGYPTTGSFPKTIAPNSTAHFTHARGGHFGSIAAVQYSGLNANGVQCAWILAWNAPVENSPPCPPNRVYVNCGPKTSMDIVTWEQILMKLDNSPIDDFANDSAMKISAEAHIHDLTADLATLIASFRLTE
ncbi:hypothetical protein RND81_05G109700 [Saponaria officinalis]|uniref:Uncharacterized protein n=1 Tax=Saponaria officinalis TaxID=3572 RepID=A0AAW1KX60_SAPOF